MFSFLYTALLLLLFAQIFRGVAFGNIFEGLNFDAAGWHGSLLGLLNPCGLLTGVLFVLLFLQPGAVWLKLKTSGGVAERLAAIAGNVWYAVLAALLGVKFFARAGRYFAAFISSCLTIMTVVALIFVPIVIAYQLWIYRIFREEMGGEDIYAQEEQPAATGKETGPSQPKPHGISPV